MNNAFMIFTLFHSTINNDKLIYFIYGFLKIALKKRRFLIIAKLEIYLVV